jgi:hypothetical protein
MINTRVLEGEGIYITIAFARNLNREPAWNFIIEDVEDCLFTSGRYGDHHVCEIEALKKAVEYLPEIKQ